MLRLASIGFGVALLASLPAVTWAQHMNQPDAPCRGVVGGASATACFDTEAKTADSDLNNSYAAIMKVLSGADREGLQRSERAWLTYRDAFCDGEYGLYGGGSGGPQARLACLVALTRNHEADLIAGYSWRVEKVSGAPFSSLALVDQIIEKLDISSFPNSVGPQHSTTKHTFADYQFTKVQKQSHGAVLIENDDGWEMSFEILSTTPKTIDVCFSDQAKISGTYNTTGPLRITMSDRGLWTGEWIKTAVPGCAKMQ